MRVLATFLLILSVSNPRIVLPSRSPVDHPLSNQARKGGQWYLAENGHAVYCYGPVMLVKDPQGGLQRVATFCKGDKTMVPLKD